MKKANKILLAKSIKKKNLYFDKYSLDKHTGEKNEKYQLAIEELYGYIYLFNTLTKNRYSCEEGLTLEIPSKEWVINKIPTHLKRTSYIDAKKIEILQGGAILGKMKSHRNGFKLCACLSDKKFYELKKLRDRSPESPGFKSNRTLKIIWLSKTPRDKKRVNEILKDLGIKK